MTSLPSSGSRGRSTIAASPIAHAAAFRALLLLAPELPRRAELAADGVAALAGAAWCGVNFWRCRQAHCLVTTPG